MVNFPILQRQIAIPEHTHNADNLAEAQTGKIDLAMQKIDRKVGKALDNYTKSKPHIKSKSTMHQTTKNLGQILEDFESSDEALEALSTIRTNGKGSPLAAKAMQTLQGLESELQADLLSAEISSAVHNYNNDDVQDAVEDLQNATALLAHEGVDIADGWTDLADATAEMMADVLGFDDVDALLAASQTEVTTRYTARVLQPMSLGDEAAAAMDGLMFNLIGGRADGEGDGAAAMAKLQHCKTQGRMSAAPEYAANGHAAQRYTPNIPGWPHGVTCKIGGNATYQQAVVTRLQEMESTDVGKELLLALAEDPGLDIRPPAASDVKREAGGQFFYSNSAGGDFVAFDPNNRLVGRGDDVADEPWRDRSPAVALFHELVHVYVTSTGGEEWPSREDPDVTIRTSGLGDMDELRTVGIPFSQTIEGVEYHFDFGDPEYHDGLDRPLFTENAFRAQLAEANGEDEYYLRPSYGAIPGQTPLPDGGHVVAD